MDFSSLQIDISTVIIYGAISILVVYLVSTYLMPGKPAPAKPAGNKPAAKAAAKPPKKKFTPPTEFKKFTVSEVAKHSSTDDAWIIVDDKVYDVTSYVEEHMGGDAILNYVGGDSTRAFRGDQHPDKVQQILDQFYIGDIQK
eukprot:TRINITY_DN7512_c0_g1_i3.p1 TRINITY_DN7512_c0_g1~~TRINITY_DN7512_c0_g1_i3.p1  ORF type:complete len:142 (-),score=36.37 TRINITY_DN7512_c0_g1_i3:55-480(-)